MIYVFKPSDNIKQKMIKFYENKKKDINPPYTVFQAFDADTTITLYESGKVVFQGLSADIEASLWTDLEKKLNNKQIKLEDKSTSEKKNVETKHTAFSSDLFRRKSLCRTVNRGPDG